MDEAGHGRVALLAARIGHFPGCRVGFLDARNDLASDRPAGVVGFDEVEKIRCDRRGELVAGKLEASLLFGGELHQGADLVQVGQPVLELPAVVVPILGAHIAPVALAG